MSAVVIVAVLSPVPQQPAEVAPIRPVSVGSAAAQTAPATATASCSKPAPSTAKGYAALWAALPSSQWGGGDVSISVPLAAGRTVWLYGDTFSSGRMVHSSAIVQDGGCLHVSRAGAQVLPDGPDGQVYWIESAFQISEKVARSEGHPEWAGLLWVAAEEQRITGTGAWDFAYTGRTGIALVSVDAAGDLAFVKWAAMHRMPAADPGMLIDLPGPAFGYSVRTHADVTLESGKPLVTVARNYDDGEMRPPSAYAPLWFEGGRDLVIERLS